MNENKNMVNFLKYRWFYFLISVLVIGSGIISVITWGYRLSIDFVGGTDLEYRMDRRVKESEVRQILKKEKIEVTDYRQQDRDIFIRTKPIDEKKEAGIRGNLEKSLKVKITPLRFETVGPVIGKETLKKTLLASLIAIVGILVYMTFAFKGFSYAFAAILALMHDFLVVIGMYSLMSHFLNAEIDILFVTALLTTMSFSVHDTIIIFDKIREYIKHEGRGNIDHFANRAVTDTMVRSLNNSMTIIFMLLALTLLGGSSIRFFVATLLIGTITGTYSSPFVATPILVWLEKRKG